VRDWPHSSFHRDVRAGIFRKIARAMSMQAENSARDEDAAAKGIRRCENEDGGLRYR
jgi:hypothetical protein